MTINTISNSIAVISNIIIVTVVPITIGIISTDNGALELLAQAVINRELRITITIDNRVI